MEVFYIGVVLAVFGAVWVGAASLATKWRIPKGMSFFIGGAAGFGFLWGLFEFSGALDQEPAKPSFTLKFNSSVTPQMADWVREKWPKVVAACPGVARYASDFVVPAMDGYYLEDMSDGFGPRVVVALGVSQSPKEKKLVEYRAFGHTCYFEILYPHADKLFIAKQPCKSLCLDTRVEDDGSDLPVLLR